MMPYQTLSNDKKMNIDLPDASFQCPSLPQLAELNHTRKILLFLTGIQFVFSLAIIFGVIYAYIFGYALETEWFNPVVQLLPILYCICFIIGSLATDRYHATGLSLFSKLLILDLIVTDLIIAIYVVYPMCLKIYPTNIIAKIIFIAIYQLIFCIVALLPAYTIRMAERLSKLLTENRYSSMK